MGKRGKKKTVILGERFGRLTVIVDGGVSKNHETLAVCKCDCGNEKTISYSKLLSGQTRSCKCIQGELRRKMHTVHGGHGTKLYRVWTNMRIRCLSKKHLNYKHYGGRGITIFEGWVNDYLSFKEWAESNGYQDGLEIDRIDVDGHYTPENCRWVTDKENSNNRRSNHFLTIFGETKTIAEWADDERCVVGYSTFISRINKYKWEPEKAITTPKRKG